MQRISILFGLVSLLPRKCLVLAISNHGAGKACGKLEWNGPEKEATHTTMRGQDWCCRRRSEQHRPVTGIPASPVQRGARRHQEQPVRRSRPWPQRTMHFARPWTEGSPGRRDPPAPCPWPAAARSPRGPRLAGARPRSAAPAGCRLCSPLALLKHNPPPACSTKPQRLTITFSH